MFEWKLATGEKLCDVVATAVWEVRGVPHYHLCQFFECAFGKLQCEVGGTMDAAAMSCILGHIATFLGFSSNPPGQKPAVRSNLIIA